MYYLVNRDSWRRGAMGRDGTDTDWTWSEHPRKLKWITDGVESGEAGVDVRRGTSSWVKWKELTWSLSAWVGGDPKPKSKPLRHGTAQHVSLTPSPHFNLLFIILSTAIFQTAALAYVLLPSRTDSRSDRRSPKLVAVFGRRSDTHSMAYSFPAEDASFMYVVLLEDRWRTLRS